MCRTPVFNWGGDHNGWWPVAQFHPLDVIFNLESVKNNEPVAIVRFGEVT